MGVQLLREKNVGTQNSALGRCSHTAQCTAHLSSSQNRSKWWSCKNMSSGEELEGVKPSVFCQPYHTAGQIGQNQHCIGKDYAFNIVTFKCWNFLQQKFSCFCHVQLFVTLWTVACQTPLSVGFSRQEYWTGWPYSLPGDLPEPGIELRTSMSPALARGPFTNSASWEATVLSIGWAFMSVEACVLQSPSTELPLLLSFEVTEQFGCHEKLG